MINRSNYSDYFMLYADGELDALQMQMVEAFLAENMDLNEEFELYLQTKIVPDEEICMPNKMQLFKPEIWDENDLSASQSTLINFVDNETNTLGNIEDLNITEELSVLAKTKLVAEALPMPHKESLYRKEDTRRPIIVLYAKRLAVAAAVLLAGTFIVNRWSDVVSPDAPEVIEVAKNDVPTTKPTVTTEIPTFNNHESTSETPNIESNVMVTTPKVAPTNTTNVSHQTFPEKKGNTNSELAPGNNNNTIEHSPSYTEVGNDFAHVRSTIDQVGQETRLAPTQNILQLKSTPTIDTKAIDNDVIINEETDNIASSLPKEAATNAEADNETEYIYIMGNKVKKDRLRGVGRTINRGFDKLINGTKRQASVNE